MEGGLFTIMNKSSVRRGTIQSLASYSPYSHIVCCSTSFLFAPGLQARADVANLQVLRALTAWQKHTLAT